MKHSLSTIESVFTSRDIRTETLDVRKLANRKYLSMFKDGPKKEYPKVFFYKNSNGSFIGLADDIQEMIDDEEFDEEFEDCVGAEEIIDFKELEKEEAELYEKSMAIWQSKEFQNKTISKYTTEELEAYIQQLTLNELTQSMIKYNICGRDLKKIRSPNQLKKLLHLESDEIANQFFETIQEEKEKEIARRSGKKINEISDKWMFKPMRKWTLRETKGWLKSFISDEKLLKIAFDAFDKHNFIGATVLKYDELESLCGVLEIDEDLGILEKIIEATQIQMDKEMDDDEEKKEEKENDNETKGKKKNKFRIRNFSKYGSKVRISKKEDCIMKYTEEDGIPRAEMECGHAIASSTMFYFLTQTFADNPRAAEIVCPVGKCKKKWRWELCQMVADMDKEEKLYYNKMRLKRINTGLSECPKCYKWSKKSENNGQLRVICECNAHFCFECGLEWKKKDSNTMCGNASCTYVKKLNAALRKQDWNTGVFWGQDQRKDGQKVVKIRACPRCLALNIHLKQCKWMKCKGCNKVFCFVCLSLADKNGKMKCKIGGDSHMAQCEIAPIQQFGNKNLKNENKELKLKCIDETKYETWSSDEIVSWIISLENNRYSKYEQILRISIAEEELTGEHLIDVNENDIKGWGIKNFGDKKNLCRKIKELVNKNNKNLNNFQQKINEGNAPTAYI
eukprot:107901_1